MNILKKVDIKNITGFHKPKKIIGYSSLRFSESITGKYGIVRSTGWPVNLILTRLNKKRMSYRNPVPHDNASINNFFEFNLSFYFELTRKLMALSDSNDRSRLMSTMNTIRSMQTLSRMIKSDALEGIIPGSTSIYSREILSNLKKEEYQSFQKNRNFLLSPSYTPTHNISLNFASAIHPLIEMIRSLPAGENFNLGGANFYRVLKNIHRVLSRPLHDNKHLEMSDSNLRYIINIAPLLQIIKNAGHEFIYKTGKTSTNFSFSFQNALPTILISAYSDSVQKISESRFFLNFSPKIIRSFPPDEKSNEEEANFPQVSNIGLFSFSYAPGITLGSKNIYRAISKSFKVEKYPSGSSDKDVHPIINRTPLLQIFKNKGHEIIHKIGKTSTNFPFSFQNVMPAILISVHSDSVQKISESRFFLNFSPKIIRSFPPDEKSNMGEANFPQVSNIGLFSFSYAPGITLGSKNIYRAISKSLKVEKYPSGSSDKDVHLIVNRTPLLQIFKNKCHEIIHKIGKTSTDFPFSFQNTLPTILISVHSDSVQKISEPRFFLNFSPKIIRSLQADEKSNEEEANSPLVSNIGLIPFSYTPGITLGSKNIHRAISKSLHVEKHSLELSDKETNFSVSFKNTLPTILAPAHSDAVQKIMQARYFLNFSPTKMIRSLTYAPEIIYGKTNNNFSFSFQDTFPTILVSTHFNAVQKIAEAKYFLSKRGKGIKNFTNQKNDLTFHKAFHPLISEILPSNVNMKEEIFGAENLFNKFQAKRNNNHTLTYKKPDQKNIPPQSTELIMKKVNPPQIENLGTVEQSMANNAASTINQKNFIKESFKEIAIDEISIAEKVYEIIERKISIERDRRGLF
jgi:hypothetical protein